MAQEMVGGDVDVATGTGPLWVQAARSSRAIKPTTNPLLLNISHLIINTASIPHLAASGDEHGAVLGDEHHGAEPIVCRWRIVGAICWNWVW